MIIRPLLLASAIALGWAQAAQAQQQPAAEQQSSTQTPSDTGDQTVAAPVTTEDLLSSKYVLAASEQQAQPEQATDPGEGRPAAEDRLAREQLTAPRDTTGRVFQLLPRSNHVLGDWGGLRTRLEDAGVYPMVWLTVNAAANLSGGLDQGATAPGEFELMVNMDMGKIAGINGGLLHFKVSNRFGKSLAHDYIGNVFGPQQIYGYTFTQLNQLYYEQALFDRRLVLRAGRFAVMNDFEISPYDYVFISQAFCGNPFGIFLNSPGVTAFVGTWGAFAKVLPTRRTYIMAGVYNGDPNIREAKYHGLNFSMHGPLFAIAEAGYQRNGLPGDNGRLGNYKLGVWYDDADFPAFETGQVKRGTWGWYVMADQVLIPFGDDPEEGRGLGIFGSLTGATDTKRQIEPLFFTAGLVVRGFMDSRPRDLIAVGIAGGNFSKHLQHAQEQGMLIGPVAGVMTHETVVEANYRFDFDKSAFFVQPGFQYIFRPGGTGTVKDAAVVATQIGFHF
jgi:porin